MQARESSVRKHHQDLVAANQLYNQVWGMSFSRKIQCICAEKIMRVVTRETLAGANRCSHGSFLSKCFIRLSHKRHKIVTAIEFNKYFLRIRQTFYAEFCKRYFATRISFFPILPSINANQKIFSVQRKTLRFFLI